VTHNDSSVLSSFLEIEGLRAELETERLRTEKMKNALLPFTKFIIHQEAKPTAKRTITVSYKMLLDAREAVGMSADGTEG